MTEMFLARPQYISSIIHNVKAHGPYAVPSVSKRTISHVEFNKSHVVLRNDVQFSKSTSDLLKATGTF